MVLQTDYELQGGLSLLEQEHFPESPPSPLQTLHLPLDSRHALQSLYRPSSPRSYLVSQEMEHNLAAVAFRVV